MVAGVDEGPEKHGTGGEFAAISVVGLDALEDAGVDVY